MRRSQLAVMGVVCALAVGSTVSGCSSRDEAEQADSTHRIEAKLVSQKDAAKVAPSSSPPSSSAKPVLRAAPDATRAMKITGSPELSAPMGTGDGQMGAPSRAGPGPGSMLGLRGTASGGGGTGSGNGMGMGGLGTKGRGGGTVSYGASVSLGGKGAVSGKRIVTTLSGSGTAALGGNVAPKEPEANTEGYQDHGVNPFVSASEDRLSTFAVDVDTASYTLARRKLVDGVLPPREAVRVEEFLNYFRYTYPEPSASNGPLAVHLDAAPSPYTPGRHLLRVGVQGRHLSISERKPAHLTFLVDVSGSMQSPDRLPLAKRALRMLVDQLRDGDTVALVTYAGNVRRVLPHTGMEHKAQIHAAIEDLSAGGSTAMASGIELAYQEAMTALDGSSLSRVIILSDGDANVGATSHSDILKTIRGHVKEGITVTTVGFGMGNYQDTMMEQLADQGNGNHFYVDSLHAARRIFVKQLGGTLEVIAQDVKLQVDFDPKQVARYRLVGYENRDIADHDFRNDRVDAGEIGSGHTVTALYELELKPGAGEGLATVRVRAKKPRGESATERAYRFPASALASTFQEAGADLRFATAVMGAAELLRRSPHAARWSSDSVRDIARAATPEGNAEREEFLTLLEKARPLLRSVAAR
ncbi:vWA domain-containing protein [Pyxidicoccus xibeiensis]|uniref:vWA domain-containing protein n=1 Tax=Pyxidicoccus xibeiensis TaxID=2906759 RepID=UPI0020A78157|nr:von Willebrand factor type A domain-containing protein [Pyxidicoccus xibeiensis]MCP3137864.1 von Willebrand factor type A domain-containing protein [Pyxidicoccus xibeiensis]